MGTLLGILILFFAVYVAVNVLYVVVRVLWYVLGGLFRAVATLISLPFRVLGLVLNLGANPPPDKASRPVLGVACRNPMCQCPNIAGARFCRRCGISLEQQLISA